MSEIKLDGGKVFRHDSCWEDICYAVYEAHHMIYIVGWSVFHKIKLIREPTRSLPRGGDLTLGDLLKYKSEEGGCVLLLVWDDKTSHNKFFLNTAGVMGTHDEETKKFFKHSSVTCVLSPCYGSSKLSFFKQQEKERTGANVGRFVYFNEKNVHIEPSVIFSLLIIINTLHAQIQTFDADKWDLDKCRQMKFGMAKNGFSCVCKFEYITLRCLEVADDNGLDTKAERSRKQLKERKNRAKKIRGVNKTKAGDAPFCFGSQDNL
ncbi:phospholipase D delta [Tanacetum coccineum]